MWPALEDGFAGSNGSAWRTRWKQLNHGGAGTVDIQSATGRQITAASAGWDALMSVSDIILRDCELVVGVNPAVKAGETIDIQLRSSGDMPGTGGTFNQSTTSYALRGYPNASVYEVASVVAGVPTNITTGSQIAYKFTAGTITWFKFRLVGATVYTKLWQDGTAEPSAWTDICTDTTNPGIAPGFVTIGSSNNGSSAARTHNFSGLKVTDLADPIVVQRLASPDGSWLRLKPYHTNVQSGSTVASDATISGTGLAGVHLNVAQYLARLRTPGLPLVGYHKTVQSGSTLATDATLTAPGLAGARLNLPVYIELLQRRENAALLGPKNVASGSTVGSDGTVVASGLPGTHLNVPTYLSLLQRRQNEALLGPKGVTSGATLASDGTATATGLANPHLNLVTYLFELRRPMQSVIPVNPAQSRSTGGTIASDGTLTATGVVTAHLNLATYLFQLQHRQATEALLGPKNVSTSATLASDGTLTAPGLAGARLNLATYLGQLRRPLQAVMPVTGVTATSWSTGATISSDGTLAGTGIVSPRLGIVTYLARLQRRQGAAVLGPKGLATSATVTADGSVSASGYTVPRLNVVLYLTRLDRRRDDMLRLRPGPNYGISTAAGFPSGLPGVVTPLELVGVSAPSAGATAGGHSAPSELVGVVSPSSKAGTVNPSQKSGQG